MGAASPRIFQYPSRAFIVQAPWHNVADHSTSPLLPRHLENSSKWRFGPGLLKTEGLRRWLAYLGRSWHFLRRQAANRPHRQAFADANGRAKVSRALSLSAPAPRGGSATYSGYGAPET